MHHDRSPVMRNGRNMETIRYMRHGTRQTGKLHPLYIGVAAVTVMTFCFAAVKMSGIYGFLIFPDEFAYWAHAAYAAGYDWSDITSLGSYFSFGYGFILFPLFALCRDAVTAYRAAVWLNHLLLIAAYVPLARTVRKMVPDASVPVELFCAVTILVPWNLFYAQMTMTESLLVFLHIVIGSLLYRYLEENRLQTLVLLMLALAYTYTVHMRTVGILLSAVSLLLVHICTRGGRQKRWHLLVVIGMAALFLALASAAKQYALANVYGGIDPALAADNDYGGQLEKLRYICTKEGFYDFAVTLMGGFLYLGMATYGLFYWGIRTLARRMPWRHSMTAAERVRAEMAAFLLISVAAQTVIATIYLLKRGEVDDYTYGRYSELVVPFVMALGFAALWKARSRTILTVVGICAVVHAAGLWQAVRQIYHTGSEKFLGYFMVGISYLYDASDYSVGRFYAGAWVLCGILSLCVAAAVLFSRKRFEQRGAHSAWTYSLFLFMAVVQMGLASHSDTIYLMQFKNAAFRDNRLADKMEALADGDRRVLFMDNGEQAFIGIIQFMKRNMEIQVIGRDVSPADPAEGISDSDILLSAYDDSRLREWSQDYDHTDIYGHFALLYNDP